MGITPADLEMLTLDQLYIMAVDADVLKSRRLVTGTPQELYAQGILKHKPYPGGLSLAARMALEAQKKQAEGLSKKERRALRRRKLLTEQNTDVSMV